MHAGQTWAGGRLPHPSRTLCGRVDCTFPISFQTLIPKFHRSIPPPCRKGRDKGGAGIVVLRPRLKAWTQYAQPALARLLISGIGALGAPQVMGAGYGASREPCEFQPVGKSGVERRRAGAISGERGGPGARVSSTGIPFPLTSHRVHGWSRTTPSFSISRLGTGTAHR